MFTKSGENMRFFGEFFVKEGEGGTIFIYLVNEEGNTAYYLKTDDFQRNFHENLAKTYDFWRNFRERMGGVFYLLTLLGIFE